MRSKIVLFGDSLTQRANEVQNRGWAASLADAYSRKADVVNRGYSGYNTRWSLELTKEAASNFSREGERNGDFLTIFFGANDSCLGGTSPQHVPLEEYKSNLGIMIDDFRSGVDQDLNIVLIPPPPVHTEAWERFCEESNYPVDSKRTIELTREYATACEEVSKSKGTEFVDLHTIICDNHEAKGTLEDCFVDGLHFSAVGNDLVFESLMQVIAKSDRLKTPDEMPLDFPLWGDVEAIKTEKVLS